MSQTLLDRAPQCRVWRGLSAPSGLRFRWSFGSVVLGLIVLGLGATACHDYRGEECRAFVISVNSRLEAIDKITKSTDPTRTVSPGDMRRLAVLYQELAHKTAATPMNTAELVRLRSEYHSMVLEASKLAGSVAEALEAKDIEKAMKAHERFGQVVSKEDVLVGQVNAFCQNR